MHRPLGLFLSVHVDDFKLVGKKQHLDPMWEELMNHVDLEEPTSLLGHVYLGCTQRGCKRDEGFFDEYRKMFESRISAGATEKLHESEEHGANVTSWSYDTEGSAKKWFERYCELANKTIEQFHKVSTPCLDDHQFKKEGRIGNGGRIVKSLLSNCPEMSVLGTHW